ncbi:MAG: sigma-70 family RNA polymerase sigma factor [Bacteroidota bacterium]|nr:sigma-70 family RNA polymerase sigma factor [Bacteroidota bacterium]
MPNRLQYNEKELLALVSQGDEFAFTKLFEEYSEQLGLHIFRLTKSHELTQEIVQDVFLKIWMSRETLSEIINFQGYLFIVSRNYAVSCLRTIARRKLNQQKFESELQKDMANVGTEEEQEGYFSIIDQAINQLPPQQKKVYLLSRQNLLTYKEIGSVMNLSPLTVKTHLQKATATIKKFVQQHNVKAMLICWIFIYKIF